MAWQLLNRAYTIGTVDGSGDITPGSAQTGFRDFTALTSGNDTYVVAVQGSAWSFMKVQKVGSILRPQTTYDSSTGSAITFDTAQPITVFSDLDDDHIVYIDGDGNAQNATAIFSTFSPELLTDLKTTPIPASGKSAAFLRNIVAGDQKGALYEWDPDETETGDDFNYVVSSLSATGRWVRQKFQLEVSVEGADSEAISSSLYAVGQELRNKRPNDVVKKVATVTGDPVDSFATLALLKAVTITDVDAQPWTDGDVVEIRGIASEGDIDAPIRATWDKDSTNTDSLDVTFIRPDDISGSNPGRFQIAAPTRAIKFTNSDATPDVSGGKLFTCADTVPALITGFDNMRDGWRITVQPGAQAQTFDHSASLVLPGGNPFTLQTDSAPVEFYKENGVIKLLGGAGGSTQTYATLTAMQALDVRDFTAGDLLELTERTAGTGRGGGRFIVSTDNISAFVTVDTDEAVFIPSSHDASGAAGGFIRVYEWLRFEDCGAYGDGVTDVGAAINRLIDVAGAVNTLGGTAKVEVVASRGNYLTSVPIRHDQGRVVVRGQGPGSLITYSGSTGHGVHLGGTHTGGGGGGTVSATKENYGGFRDFHIKASSATHSSGAGLNCEDMDRWEVYGLLIEGFKTTVRLWNCDNTNLRNIRGVYGSRSAVMDYFIHVAGDDDSDTAGFNTSNRFTNCDFIPGSGSNSIMLAGLRAEQFDGLWMTNCHFIYADYGIDITSSDGTSGTNHSVSAFFVNSYVDTTGITGIRIAGDDTKDIHFTDCNVRDAGGVTSIATPVAANERGVTITPDASGTVDGIQFTGGRIWQSDREGLYAADGSGTVENLSIVGTQFFDNNVDDTANIADVYLDVASANLSSTSHSGNVSGGRVLHIGSNAGDVTFNFSGSHSTASTKYFDERSSKLGDLILGSSIRMAGSTMQRTDDDSSFTIRGGDALNSGSEIILYGNAHATLAGDHYARFGYDNTDGAYRIQHVNAAGTPTNIITADYQSLDIHRDTEFLNDALFSAFLGLGAVTEPTISSGSLTVTGSMVRPQGEGAAADFLDTIVTTGIAEGTIVILNGGNESITVRDESVGGGNIRPRTSAQHVLSSLRKFLAVRLNSDGFWYELWRSEA